MSVRAEEAVVQIESKVAESLGSQRFNVWFKNATRLQLTNDYLRICAPNHFIGEWIERHFGDALIEAAREVTGRECSLGFAIDPALAKSLPKKQLDRQFDFLNNADRIFREHRRSSDDADRPLLKGRLEDFVVGPSNRLAHAAGVSVIENPGGAYNPLFVHGGCGLGKTHLLQAICNGLAERHPGLRWRYVTGEEFMNDYICAVKAREMDAFHKRYRDLEVLVIDDVHFLANKRATQEEFLNTVKAIDAAGKQLVLASDAHPKLISHFSESLVSRFLSGMLVRIETPDLEVRTGVLRRRAAKLNAEISDAVITFIADNVRANIRELEGALVKVVAQAQVIGQPITASLAERAIREVVRQTAPVVMLSDIENMVAIYFGLTPADLHTSRKSRTIALARGIAMYLARKHTDMSFPEIGRFMGNKNHSTVILANRRIGKLVQDGATATWMTPGGSKEQDVGAIVAAIEEAIIGTKDAEAPAPRASRPSASRLPASGAAVATA